MGRRRQVDGAGFGQFHLTVTRLIPAFDPFLAAFLLIPLVALIARELGKLKLPLGLIFVILVPAGWLLLSLRVQWYFATLDALARHSPNPSPEQLIKLQHDGGAMVFALYLGWAMSAIYFGFCFGVIKTAGYFIRRRQAEPMDPA